MSSKKERKRKTYCKYKVKHVVSQKKKEKKKKVKHVEQDKVSF